MATKTTEAASKEDFFDRIGALSDEMIAAHGRDFAMGALILGARFIAQGQSVADAKSEDLQVKLDH
jgi:hypothetical protein